MSEAMAAPAPAPLVSCRDLKKDYVLLGKRIEVLKGIDLDLGAGELVSLIGHSGVGKSTFLHVVGTLDAPTSGTVRYDGEEVFKRDDATLADFRNASIGFVFQFHYLLREFTALENTMMPALVARVPMPEATRRAREILVRVGLEDRLEHKPSELSGGEQQRVALARALVMRPRLLLADEPTGNLDEDTAEGIHQILFDMNRELGITALVVTHNPALAERMPRRLRMVDGRIEEAD